MKTIILFMVCMMLYVATPGQDKKESYGEGEVISPEFKGENFVLLGQFKNSKSLNDYLQSSVNYPEECIKSKVEGTEVIQFDVTPEGQLTGFEIINSVSPEIDEHVIALLKNTSGLWTPGTVNGEPVTMKKEISVAFKWMEFKDFFAKDFRHLAKIHYEKGNRKLLVKKDPQKALKHFDNGIRYLPSDESLLLMRGICRYQLGDEEGARRDWDRMATLKNSEQELQKLADQLFGLEGYEGLPWWVKERAGAMEPR